MPKNPHSHTHTHTKKTRNSKQKLLNSSPTNGPTNRLLKDIVLGSYLQFLVPIVSGIYSHPARGPRLEPFQDRNSILWYPQNTSPKKNCVSSNIWTAREYSQQRYKNLGAYQEFQATMTMQQKGSKWIRGCSCCNSSVPVLHVHDVHFHLRPDQSSIVGHSQRSSSPQARATANGAVVPGLVPKCPQQDARQAQHQTFRKVHLMISEHGACIRLISCNFIRSKWRYANLSGTPSSGKLSPCRHVYTYI